MVALSICASSNALVASPSASSTARTVLSLSAMAEAESAPGAAADAGKPTLYDMPVSNNGARARMLLYYKGVEDQVEIVSPATFKGGLRSDEYLALNPQAKMPLLVEADGLAIPESDTIARHLRDRFADSAPSFVPASLAGRTRADMICRQHDLYIGPIQGSMYKAAPPFAAFSSRPAALAEMRKQLDVLEAMVPAGAKYLAGDELSLADVTVFPTAVFLTHMLPKFGWAEADIFGPRLGAWWARMCAEEPAAARVRDEILGALAAWDGRGRWDAIRGAGLRDDAPPTLFDKILAGEIPSAKVWEDELCYAFRDINPVAPTHVLLIPKRRDGLAKLGDADAEHAGILGHLMVTAAAIAKQEGLDDFRLVANSGEGACQSVFHLHLHIIGGAKLTWPPGCGDDVAGTMAG